MADLEDCIKRASHQVSHCLDRIEFFKLKSQASYRMEAQRNYERGADLWGDICELLFELKELRQKPQQNHE